MLVNERRPQRRTKAGRLVSSITREELALYFHLPSEKACKELGVGLTILKRVCRRLGIPRWPYNRVPRAAQQQEEHSQGQPYASGPQGGSQNGSSGLSGSGSDCAPGQRHASHPAAHLPPPHPAAAAALNPFAAASSPFFPPQQQPHRQPLSYPHSLLPPLPPAGPVQFGSQQYGGLLQQLGSGGSSMQHFGSGPSPLQHLGSAPVPLQHAGSSGASALQPYGSTGLLQALGVGGYGNGMGVGGRPGAAFHTLPHCGPTADLSRLAMHPDAQPLLGSQRSSDSAQTAPTRAQQAQHEGRCSSHPFSAPAAGAGQLPLPEALQRQQLWSQWQQRGAAAGPAARRAGPGALGPAHAGPAPAGGDADMHEQLAVALLGLQALMQRLKQRGAEQAQQQEPGSARGEHSPRRPPSPAVSASLQECGGSGELVRPMAVSLPRLSQMDTGLVTQYSNALFCTVTPEHSPTQPGEAQRQAPAAARATAAPAQQPFTRPQQQQQQQHSLATTYAAFDPAAAGGDKQQVPALPEAAAGAGAFEPRGEGSVDTQVAHRLAVLLQQASAALGHAAAAAPARDRAE